MRTHRALHAALAAAALIVFGTASGARADDRVKMHVSAVASSNDDVLAFDDATWKNAAEANLGWDYQYSRPAAKPTRIRMLRTKGSVIVRFDAWQSVPVVATQRTDGQGENSDDQVSVYLWPGGVDGYEYRFTSNPLGTRYQSSSADTSFAPRWRTKSRLRPDGFDVIFEIPLSVFQGATSLAWRAQFERTVKSTGERFLWAHDVRQSGSDQVIYSGELSFDSSSDRTLRRRPRVQLYELGRMSPSTRGVRTGTDVSIPLDDRTAIVMTQYPDYTNVEADQQTIAPTAFQRQYREVRPFYTQGSFAYNNLTCLNCLYFPLYTPAIPTPDHGYAVEGRERGLSFGAFSVAKDGRTDGAQGLSYTTPSRAFKAVFQRDTVSDAAGTDATSTASLKLSNVRTNVSAYANFAHESGAFVDDGARASYGEAGVFYSTAKAFFGAALQKVGASFHPRDAYVLQSDIAGFNVNGSRQFAFGPQARLRALTVAGSYDAFHAKTGALDQVDSAFSLTADLPRSSQVIVSTGSSQLAGADRQLHFFNQNGIAATYEASSATPTGVTYNSGSYGDGTLSTWLRQFGKPLGHRIAILLEDDDTRYASRHGVSAVQVLERLNFLYSIDKDSALTVGLRRIRGNGPPDPSNVGVPSPLVDTTNVAAAYHRRFHRGELFVVFGDPNAGTTYHTLFVKLVQFVGADKGT